MATRFFFMLLCILPNLAARTAVASDVKKDAEAITSLETPHSVQDYERCDWLVTYRNRTYDLAPLTRGSLGRPLDGDIISVLRRVPEASMHLDQVDHKAKLARIESMVGSASITGFILSRIFRSDPKVKVHPEKQKTIDLVGLFGLVVFVKSTIDSHNATEDARTELGLAVESFNQNSSHKIEPNKEGQ